MVGRQQAKELLRDKPVTLRCPTSATGGVRICLRAVERHERDVLGLQMAYETGIGIFIPSREHSSVIFISRAQTCFCSRALARVAVRPYSGSNSLRPAPQYHCP